MSGYQIITDATADLTEAWASQIGVEIIPMECQLGGVPYTFGPGGNITGEEFFAGMRGGKMGSTSQINPHFIYNTLSSIRFLLEMDKVQEAGEMVFYFSKLLRQTLSRSVEFIPLGEELDTLKCYVELQHLRYPDTFDYSCEVDEALRDNTLPKLLLQPVVENSIFHGVGRHKIHIRLRGWLEGDTLILRVEDDGVGISKDKIDQVMNKDLQINRVGLKNVQERIRLNYGPGYGLTVTGGPAGGTVVTFRLPRTR